MRIDRSFLLALGLLSPLAPARAADTLPDGFYRYPAIGGSVIVFAAEGDLWKVPAAGGMATRLTSFEGEERFPRLSPDGKWIAFTAQYEGNDDVYVMGIDGGEPARITWHPAGDQALGWSADGRVLFRSRRDSPNYDYHIFQVERLGGVPEMLPLEPAAWITFEPNGRRVAMQKIGLEFHNWKRYKGGEAEQIYVGTLDPLAFTEVTQWDGKDAFPMWWTDGRIYFVTDRWGRPNLASMNPDGSDLKRLTEFQDYDVRWPSMGDGKIVYQHKMDLWVYDLATRSNQQVEVHLPSDRLQVRERFVDPFETLNSWGLSVDGERIVLESRGDLFVTRTHKKGLIRRVTESSADRTKFPSFSPDGAEIAAWTEVDGEEQLVLHSADNSAARKVLTHHTRGWNYAPLWSPDGKRLAWGDESHHLRVIDKDGGREVTADSSGWEITEIEWSTDSRFLAYSVYLPNGFNQVRVWDGTTGVAHAISDPACNSFTPSWDPTGKYLVYMSDRYVNPFLDRWEARFVIDNATQPILVALKAGTKLPFGGRADSDPKDDKDDKEDKGDKEDEGEDKKGKDAKKDEKKEDAPKPVEIDFEGIADRIVQVPVEPGNYFGLRALDGKLHFLAWENQGMWPPDGGNVDDDEAPRGLRLLTYEIEKEKLSELAQGVLGYDVSGDGKVLVYRTKGGFTRVEAGSTSAPEGDGADEAAIDLSGWTIRIDPRAEWAQMLREAWRLQRDFFYDPNMHGVDWKAVWDQYGTLIPRMSSRDDLEDLLGELLGELSVGHAYHWGGDVRRGRFVPTGLLGADLVYDPPSGFWQIKKIYAGDYPDPKMSSPLARPDLGVKPGQWLVAIDGRPLTKGEDYLRRLQNRAGGLVELSLNDAPKLEGARRIVVETIGNDNEVRYATWVRENRAHVDARSGGKVGYIHLRDMGSTGLRQFARDYPPQWNKQGLIIDDRWNGGGFVAPMILAHLDRKLLAVGTGRYGGRETSPDRCFHGHQICLINRQGGSDCETFAQGFKDFGMGPVVGTRTWGGWVGIRGGKPFRDGGMTTQPEFTGYSPTGRFWLIEGHGVDPDVPLDLGPEGFLKGQDLQLDYAIDDLMKKIAADPRELPNPPAIPPRPLVPK